MPLRDILALLLVVAIWGFNFVVISFSVDVLPPILAAALRFTFMAFPALLFVKPPKGAWRAAIGFGLSFGFALYAFLNLAIFEGMPAGLASVVLQVQAFFTILIAFFVLGDRPRRLQIIGGIIAFSGVGVIAMERFDGASYLPFALTICGAAAWGIANVIAKRAEGASPISIAVWGALVATIPLFAMSFAMEGVSPLIAFFVTPDFVTWGAILFLAYPASLFGLAVWNTMLRKHPASVVAPFTLLVPITGLLSGWLVLGETITPMEIVGGVLVVLGLGATVFKSRAGRTLPQVPN